VAQIGSTSEPGVVPRAVQRLLQLAKAQPENMFVFVLSVLELYNDVFYDLLDEGGCATKKQRSAAGQAMAAKKIEVVRSGHGSQLRGEYTKMQMHDADSAVAAIEASLARRSTSGTMLNDRSSRSHAMVILQVQQASIERRGSSSSVGEGSSRGSTGAAGCTSIGTLYMVDLAGSERIKLSQVQGEGLEQAKHINKSLSALGNVLTALSSKKKEKVPYRDSKLTLLLQDALGGNSKTMMITCINPKKESYAFSSVALQYAVRAKHVKNGATINLDADKTSEMEQLKRENLDLRRRLLERQAEFETVVMAQAQDPGEQAIKMDKIKQLMLMHEREKQEHKAKFAHVINTSQMAYNRLETEVAAYCDKLLQAERTSEQRQQRIQELEAHVEQERLDKAELHARQLQVCCRRPPLPLYASLQQGAGIGLLVPPALICERCAWCRRPKTRRSWRRPGRPWSAETSSSSAGGRAWVIVRMCRTLCMRASGGSPLPLLEPVSLTRTLSAACTSSKQPPTRSVLPPLAPRYWPRTLRAGRGARGQ